MALQIWLPLNKNGDLSNKGLANITVTNNGATYNSSGKIGGCYLFNSTNLKGNWSGINGMTEMSGCCWVYLTTLEGCQYFFHLGAQTGYAAKLALQYDDGKIYSLVNGNSKNSTLTLTTNTWYHLAVTVNSTTVTWYINGVKSKELNVSGTFSASNNFAIGARTNGTSGDTFAYLIKSGGKLNDVRIYDHCLTPQEVKEISKGLVLHYPLNDPYIEGTTNLLSEAYSYPNGHIYSSSDSSNAYATVGVISSNTGNEIVTYSAYVTNNSDTTIYPRLRGLKSGSTYGSYVSGNTIPAGKSGWVAVTLTYITDSSTYAGTNAYLRWLFGKARNTINGNFIIQYAQLERKSYRTAWTLGGTTRIPTIIYDSSGYNNNGTITGTLTTNTDTPRYDRCPVFSNDAYISAGKTHTALLDEYTISAWINPSTDDTNHHNFISCTQNGGMQLRIENKQFRHIVYLDNAYALNTSTTTISPNTWYHVVGVFKKGVGIKLYVNGVKESDISNSGTLTYNSTIDLMIGNEPDSNNLATGYSFSGKISDVRLYSTALSEQDIKALYQEAAFIDHKGDVGCYLFYEDNDSQITKTGQIRTEEFEEISDLSDGVAKVYELKIECNQLIEI